MSGIYNRYRSQGLEVVMAAINPDPKVDDFIKRYQVLFPVGTANGDLARVFFQIPMTSPGYVPWFVIVDRKGVIRTQYTGGDGWFFNGGELPIVKAIEPLLAEKPAAAVSSKKKK